MKYTSLKVDAGEKVDAGQEVDAGEIE